MVGISALWTFTITDKETGKVKREFKKYNQVTDDGLRWLLGRSMGIEGNNAGATIGTLAGYRPVQFLMIGGGTSTAPTVIPFDGGQTKIQYKYLSRQPATVLATTVNANRASVVVTATFDLLDLQSPTIGVDSATGTTSTVTSFLATEAALYTADIPAANRGDAGADPRNAPPTGDFMHSRVVLDSSGTTGVAINQTEILTISITEQLNN
uniref:Virion structural protein n=1 Tax=Nitrosopumivirus cobalaminus TaxID=3158414 RepID=A0AAU7N484_9VIRU